MNIKKTIFTLTAAAAMLVSVNAFAADNILVNGSCEQDFIGESGWRFKETGGWYIESGFEHGLTSTNPFEGGNALYFHSATVAQRVKLERNKTYVLSFAVRADEEKEINYDICDGSQDWPASYSVQHGTVKANSKWQTVTTEFECGNTQDYLVSFNLWDEVNVYLDDIKLVEKDSYISRLMTGVNGAGEISYTADYVGNGRFVAALFDENNRLTAVMPNEKQGTFKAAPDYGDYTVKCYLSDGDNLVSKSKIISYDEESKNNETNSIGAVSGLSLSEHEINMTAGGKEKAVDAFLTPRYAYNNDVIWESSDESVASVSGNGIITPIKSGIAVITAKCGGYEDKCSVNVSEKTEENVGLDKSSIELKEIDSVYPLHAVSGGENITWKSDNEGIASVTDGIVTAKSAGSTVITASNGYSEAKCSVKVTVSDNTITNDTFYKDTDGNNIYSQGGGIYKFGDKYYWYGCKYKEGPIYAANPENGKAGNAAFEAFTCYSSTDLVNWKFEGYPLQGGPEPEGWAGRMGVAYNQNTKKYILISQYAPGIIFAAADSPTGPFTTDHIFTGELPIEKGGTGDQTIFQDEDGKAYMICATWEGREYLYIIPLRDKDFLDFDYDNIKLVYHDEDGNYIDEAGNIDTRDKKGIEGNCMFRYGNKYYFTGSDLYGWYSSRVYYFKADDIFGDYNKETGLPHIMPGARDGYAHNLQAGFYVTVHGTEQDQVIYCGDRWGDFAGNGIGYNQWVPITIGEDGTPYFNDLHQWRLDAQKGTWEIGEGNNYIKNSEFENDRHITNTPTGWETSDNVGGYANSNEYGKVSSGNFVWQQKAPEDYIADIKQTITGLPDGTYTLTAFVRSSGGQNVASLYAETTDGRVTKSVKTGIDEWTEEIVSDSIKITDGKCTIGLYSDAHANEWVQIDNLRLVKNME